MLSRMVDVGAPAGDRQALAAAILDCPDVAAPSRGERLLPRLDLVEARRDVDLARRHQRQSSQMFTVTMNTWPAPEIVKVDAVTARDGLRKRAAIRRACDATQVVLPTMKRAAPNQAGEIQHCE